MEDLRDELVLEYLRSLGWSTARVMIWVFLCGSGDFVVAFTA